MLKRNTLIFVVCAIVWEIIIAILYGIFFRFNVAAFSNMSNNKNVYSWVIDPTTSAYVTTDSTQPPFTHIVLLIAIALLVVGNPFLTQDSP